MATTPHTGATLVEQAQAQKEVTVNAALIRLDALLNIGAIDKDLNTPPGAPAAGAVYIVGSAPTGDWTGQAGTIAYFDQIWKFITPNEGMRLWVNDEDLHYTYRGSAWSAAANQGRIAANSGTSYAINLQNANLFEITLTGNCTFTFTNPAASGIGTEFTLILKQDGTGGRSVAWPASVKWPSGSAPSLATGSNVIHLLSFLTTDGGASWYGTARGTSFA